jgi:DivIVA domain-containing protein
MGKFKKTIYGYDPDEVNAYLDEIISLVEKIVASNKEKNNEIIRLSNELEETRAKYDEIKENFNRVIDNKR